MAEPPVVIYNPAAGRGLAGRTSRTLRKSLPADARLLATNAPGMATTLTMDAIHTGARWIIAAGGDGTTHEVANGILRAGHNHVLFTPLPLGSMNDYAFTLGLQEWWRQGRPWNRLETLQADVGMIRGGGREQFFVNCCGIGFNGMVTTEARAIRWLRGLPLYVLAVIRALQRHFRKPLFTINLDGQISARPTLAVTLGIGQREGGFPLTRLAQLDDGRFDLLQVGKISRWELIRHLPAMISGHLPSNHPQLVQTTGRLMRLTSAEPLCIHIDGEFFCLPSDQLYTIEVELLPKRLLVSCCPPYLYGRRS